MTKSGLIELESSIATIEARLKRLLELDAVKEYAELLPKLDSLKQSQTQALLDCKIEEITNCEHIFVVKGYDSAFDGHRTDHATFYQCIRCGLDSSYLIYTGNEPFLLPIQSRMRELYTHRKDRGILIDPKCQCSIGLATSIYQKIIKLYPNMNRNEIIAAFHEELNDYNKGKEYTKK